jgi:uncharacterized protein (DUF1810 family)
VKAVEQPLAMMPEKEYCDGNEKSGDVGNVPFDEHRKCKKSHVEKIEQPSSFVVGHDYIDHRESAEKKLYSDEGCGCKPSKTRELDGDGRKENGHWILQETLQRAIREKADPSNLQKLDECQRLKHPLFGDKREHCVEGVENVVVDATEKIGATKKIRIPKSKPSVAEFVTTEDEIGKMIKDAICGRDD